MTTTNESEFQEVQTVNEIFSDYVLRLGSGGEPPDDASFKAVREELRTVIVGVLHRRGLWRAPPSHLGLVGSDWSEGGLDELVTEAYTFIFLRRITGLRNQQRLKGDIRPLVWLNVGHLLTELQRKADPLGYRVFGRLRDAIRSMLDQGRVFALGLDAKDRIRNDTVISFREGLAPLTPARELEEPVRRWNDVLLPKLVTAEGHAVPKVVRHLAEKVLTLAGDGVAAFCFGDLITLLKADVRGRWRGIWEGTLGDTSWEDGDADAPGQLVGVVQAEEEPDWGRRLVLIQDCVTQAIDALTPKSRRDLWALWRLVRATRVIPGETGPLPALTEIGELLKLSRDRVRQLFVRLEPIVRKCLETAGRRGAPAERRDVDVAGRGRR